MVFDCIEVVSSCTAVLLSYMVVHACMVVGKLL